MIVSQENPVDAVVTWVDGENPAHRAKLNAYLESIGHRPRIAHPNRYRETGEFAYCIASLLRFAPWLQRIHIVADNQQPEFMPLLQTLGLGERVTLVDHRVLFRGHERALPTFNIRSIKSMFWNIPGLAEQFLFLNDDFMLLRHIEPDDFFREGRAVLTGRWMPQQPDVILDEWLHRSRYRPEQRPGNHRAQAKAARLAGYRLRYFKVPHKPHALLKSLMTDFMSEHPQLLAHNISFPLRDESQFLADALVNHLALRQGRALVDNRIRTLRFKPSDYQADRLTKLLQQADSDPTVRYACFQSLESINEEQRPQLFDWLNHRIGKPEAIFRQVAAEAGKR